MLIEYEIDWRIMVIVRLYVGDYEMDDGTAMVSHIDVISDSYARKVLEYASQAETVIDMPVDDRAADVSRQSSGGIPADVSEIIRDSQVPF